MKLSKSQFHKFLQKNRLVLSLIGMSNIGKTYWSQKMSALGFQHINCDDLVEARLEPKLKKLGYSGIADVSRWMGQPYEKKFAKNQNHYLSLETEVMENIFGHIQKKLDRNIIIDTTGSVVHTGEKICHKLRQHSLVVYIEATENMKEEMFQRYMLEPKPVIFGNWFNRKTDENEMQSLERCYRKLLDVRSRLYAKHADVVIPRSVLGEKLGVPQFISLIKQYL